MFSTFFSFTSSSDAAVKPSEDKFPRIAKILEDKEGNIVNNTILTHKHISFHFSLQKNQNKFQKNSKKS